MTQEQIDLIFDFEPLNDGQRVKVRYLYQRAKQMAEDINAMCPESREKALAITYLQGALKWAEPAIAIHGREKTDQRLLERAKKEVEAAAKLKKADKSADTREDKKTT
jgi:hypothetical protein